MIQISSNNKISKQAYPYAKINTFAYTRMPALKNDTFESRSQISFKGVEGLFKTKPNDVPQIVILPGVRDEFVSTITKQISKYSPQWLKKFKNNNYKIILSPTFSEAYKSQKVFAPDIELAERQNPKGTLGITYSEGRYGKNFFVFCDKPPLSDTYMDGIVNHELSHGVVYIKKLDQNIKTLSVLNKDIELIKSEHKLEKLTSDERNLASHFFFNPSARLPIDEILADTFAWNNGSGCYGSGLVMDVENPDLMKTLFPNLSEHLKSV